MRSRTVGLLVLLATSVAAHANGVSVRLRPVSAVEAEGSTMSLWCAGLGDRVVLSATPERLSYSRGSIESAVELDLPVIDGGISRTDAFVGLPSGVFIFWAKTTTQSVILRTDGTPAGTYPVWVGPYEREMVTGSIVACGTIAYFAAGGTLWRTDGTASGTYSLAAPAPLAIHDVGGNALCFGGSPMCMWRTDGTLAGTAPVAGSVLSLPNLRYFYSGTTNDLLIYGDGPTHMTQQLRLHTAGGALNIGGPLGRPDWMFGARSTPSLFSISFMADSLGYNWYEVWWTDGNPSNTRYVGTFRPVDYCGVAGEADAQRLFVRFARSFSYSAPADQIAVFGSDGSFKWVGPRVPGDVVNASRPTVCRGRAYFTANDGVHGRELWSSGGTQANTSMVFDHLPGIAGAVGTQGPRSVGNRVYFHSRVGGTGLRLWMLDLCPADFNNNSIVSDEDILGYIQSYLRSDSLADMNSDDRVAVGDLFDYIGTFFAGCSD